MKSMFEYMTTIIIMMIVSFIFISFISIELQLVYARNYHTRTVENIQYIGNYDEISSDEYPNFSFELESNNVLKVTYHYNIDTPLFGNIAAKDLIGYAR